MAGTPWERGMSLEGRLRDLGLAEVLQLLSGSRKTGTLYLHAPLHGRRATVSFQHGAIVDARSWSAAVPSVAPAARTAAEAREVEATALDLLLWRDGTFRFAPPAQSGPSSAAIHLAVEPLLIEAAQRAELWQRIGDRVPHARVVPAFVDVEPQQLPLLRLSPAQWELLTRVDGVRDLPALAAALGKDLLDVAERVHGLIGAGLLTLREEPVAPRRNPTPPTVDAIPAPVAGITGDLWIPSTAHTRHSSTPPSTPVAWPTAVPFAGPATEADLQDGEDSLFDPVELGVITESGLPAPNPPVGTSGAWPVASSGLGPSLLRGETDGPVTGDEGARWCRLGDDAARRGDFELALTHWTAALRQPESIADAARVREAMALTARLHALLHP
jgi:hypothetical protein